MIRSFAGLALAVLIVAPAALADDEGAWEAGPPQFFALSVADIDVMASWYETMLGLERGEMNGPADGTIRQTTLANGRLFVELVQHHEAKDRSSYGIERSYLVHGIFKVGFFVQDIDRAVAELETKGASFRGGIIDLPEQGIRMILVEDPEGNIVQLFEAIEE